MDSVDSIILDHYIKTKKKLCYIINVEAFDSPTLKCIGASIDCERLEKVFKELNFIVEIYKDFTANAIKTSLKTLSERPDLGEYSMLICILMSHGNKGVIHGTDGYTVKINTLIGFFKEDECKALVGRPKLFFIQACQGTKTDSGIQCDAVKSKKMEKLPIEPDFLIGYCTVPGYVSYLRNNNGSWYIQTLCREIENHAKTKDIVQILVNVNANVAENFSSTAEDPEYNKKLQMPSFMCMLRNRVWLVDDHQ